MIFGQLPATVRHWLEEPRGRGIMLTRISGSKAWRHDAVARVDQSERQYWDTIELGVRVSNGLRDENRESYWLCEDAVMERCYAAVPGLSFYEFLTTA